MVDPRGSARPVGSGAEHPFLTALLERVLVFDGAFGTWMQGHDLGPDDFGGEVLERSEEHTSELQSHSDLHSFPTRRSSDLECQAGRTTAPRNLVRWSIRGEALAR